TDHDFRRIRTADDYRRLVPLTTRAELWRAYWEPALPHFAGATWTTAPSPALRAAGAAALRTALALAAQARPQLRLFAGRVAWLREDVALPLDAARPSPRACASFAPACLPWEEQPAGISTPVPAAAPTV